MKKNQHTDIKAILTNLLKDKKLSSNTAVVLICALVCLVVDHVDINKFLGIKEQPTAEMMAADIVGLIKNEADLVTTEVTIQKLALYDSSKSERFSITDPNTWKFGERKCIIPVEVKVKYGYDLQQLSVEDVKVADDSTAVYVMLPKPKVIDSGYNLYIDKKSVVSIATGLRTAVGHETEEEIRKKAYDQIINGNEIEKYIDTDIEKNARMLISSLIKSLGYKDVTVVTKN